MRLYTLQTQILELNKCGGCKKQFTIRIGTIFEDSFGLLLKKPDLLGDSKWQFVYNKTIEAKIEDEDFLDKIRRRKISVRAGVKIPCLMQLEYDLSDRIDIIQKSENIISKKSLAT